MFTPPSHLYPPLPNLIAYAYDYEQQFNGITFHTRVHQAGHVIAHYTTFLSPGEQYPRFINTVCTIQPNHSLECRSTISTHIYQQPLHVIHIPSPYPPTLLGCPPALDPQCHYRDWQPGRDPLRHQPSPIPHSSAHTSVSRDSAGPS